MYRGQFVLDIWEPKFVALTEVASSRQGLGINYLFLQVMMANNLLLLYQQ